MRSTDSVLAAVSEAGTAGHAAALLRELGAGAAGHAGQPRMALR
jgi:hypothetical protein